MHTELVGCKRKIRDLEAEDRRKSVKLEELKQEMDEQKRKIDEQKREIDKLKRNINFERMAKIEAKVALLSAQMTNSQGKKQERTTLTLASQINDYKIVWDVPNRNANR